MKRLSLIPIFVIAASFGGSNLTLFAQSTYNPQPVYSQKTYPVVPKVPVSPRKSTMPPPPPPPNRFPVQKNKVVPNRKNLINTKSPKANQKITQQKSPWVLPDLPATAPMQPTEAKKITPPEEIRTISAFKTPAPKSISPKFEEPMPGKFPVIISTPKPRVHQEPAIKVDWFGPDSVRLKSTANYVLKVKNTSLHPVHRVIIRYSLPKGQRLISSSPTPVAQQNMLVWELGKLGAGEDKQIQIKLFVEEKTTLNFQAAVTFSSVANLQARVYEPKLTLSISAPKNIDLGRAVPIQFTVHNPGDGPTEPISVLAEIPGGLEHIRGPNINIDLGPVDSGETRSFQLVCMTRESGSFTINAKANAGQGLRTSATSKIQISQPSIDLAMEGPRLRYLERKATYKYTVHNPGGGPVSNVFVREVIPQGFSFVGISDGGRYDAATRTVTWYLGDMTPGQKREVQLEVVASQPGIHKHRAVVTAARGLKATSEVTTRVEGVSALLMELADVEDPVEIGAETTYEIRVTNTGSKTETNLQLTCSIPDGMELLNAECLAEVKHNIDGKKIIFAPVPRLAPRADVLYRVRVRGTTAGDLRFRAHIQSDGLTRPVLREESTKVYGDS